MWATKDRERCESLDELLECADIPASEVQGSMAKVTSSDGTHRGASRVHDLGRLPAEFHGLPNGHSGSHQFLVDDFVTACAAGTQPPNNVWMAARYLVPGLLAHESSLRGGEQLEVPDLGAPPTGS